MAGRACSTCFPQRWGRRTPTRRSKLSSGPPPPGDHRLRQYRRRRAEGLERGLERARAGRRRRPRGRGVQSPSGRLPTALLRALPPQSVPLQTPVDEDELPGHVAHLAQRRTQVADRRAPRFWRMDSSHSAVVSTEHRAASKRSYDVATWSPHARAAKVVSSLMARRTLIATARLGELADPSRFSSTRCLRFLSESGVRRPPGVPLRLRVRSATAVHGAGRLRGGAAGLVISRKRRDAPLLRYKVSVNAPHIPGAAVSCARCRVERYLRVRGLRRSRNNRDQATARRYAASARFGREGA